MRRYQDRLYNTVYRLVDNAEDAQDVVQEAFLNAYQSLDSFKGDSLFFTWLYRIAVNTAISLKRKQRVVAAASTPAGTARRGVEPLDPSEFSRPGHALEQAEQERRIQQALNRLSPEHRAVLILKDMEGQKYEDDGRGARGAHRHHPQPAAPAGSSCASCWNRTRLTTRSGETDPCFPSLPPTADRLRRWRAGLASKAVLRLLRRSAEPAGLPAWPPGTRPGLRLRPPSAYPDFTDRVLQTIVQRRAACRAGPHAPGPRAAIPFWKMAAAAASCSHPTGLRAAKSGGSAALSGLPPNAGGKSQKRRLHHVGNQLIEFA